MTGIFKKVILKDSTGSTNADAAEMARRDSGKAHGTVVAARSQTAGRGRSGRSWFSVPGSGITASFILKNPFPARKNFFPTLIASCAVCELLEKGWKLKPGIKWPNDVMVRGRKIAGILIENEGGICIIGIGLNLDTDFGSMPLLAGTATSVMLETGRSADWASTLERLTAILGRRWTTALKSEPTAFKSWKKRLIKPAGVMKVISEGRTFSGRMAGVTPEGGLKLKTTEGVMVFNSCDEVHIGDTGKKTRPKKG